MTPGQLLEALLAKRGITSNALASQLGGGGLQSAMSRLISGKIPRAETLRPVAEFFGVDPSVFQTDQMRGKPRPSQLAAQQLGAKGA